MELDVILWLLVGSIATGILSGLFSIGGGLLMTPLLIWLLPKLGVPQELAIYQAAATSLMAVIPIGSVNVFKHHQAGTLRWDIFKKIAPAVILGSLLGSFVFSQILKPQIIQCLYLVMLLAAAARMLNKKNASNEVVVDPVHVNQDQWLIVQLGVVAVITTSSLVGVGGALLLVPLLGWVGYSTKSVIGASSLVILMTSLVSSAVYLSMPNGGDMALPYSIGRVNLLGVIFLAPIAMFFVSYGHKIACGLSESTLNRLFGGLTLLIAIKTLYGLAAL